MAEKRAERKRRELIEELKLVRSRYHKATDDYLGVMRENLELLEEVNDLLHEKQNLINELKHAKEKIRLLEQGAKP